MAKAPRRIRVDCLKAAHESAGITSPSARQATVLSEASELVHFVNHPRAGWEDRLMAVTMAVRKQRPARAKDLISVAKIYAIFVQEGDDGDGLKSRTSRT